MSATRKQKIDKLLNHAKTILPKIEAQIKKDMKDAFESNTFLKEVGEKFEIDRNELKEQVKERLIEDLKKYALKEYSPNRKTLSEYVEIVLLRLGYE